MARLELACPRCGEELKVTTKIRARHSNGPPKFAEMTIRVHPCEAWCTILGGDE